LIRFKSHSIPMTVSNALQSLFSHATSPSKLLRSSLLDSDASRKRLPSRLTKRSDSRIALGILGVNEEWAENDATGWNEDVNDERAHALGIQVERLELTINDMQCCINGLKLEVENEQHLRHASEQALRDEMSRSLRVVTEQVALRADLAMANSARGSGSNVAHDIQQQPVQDLAVLRQEMLATVAELESGAQQLAGQAAKQQIDLLWPALQQQVHAVVTEVRGGAQDLAREAAAEQMELVLPLLEKKVTSQKDASVLVEKQVSIQRSRSSIGNGDASVLRGLRPKVDEQSRQLLRLEENIEALRQRVVARERDSRPVLTFRDKLADCLSPREATPNREGSVAS